MSSRTERSPLKAEPLRPPGQSIRSTKIDLVLGRLMPMMWLTTVAATLTVVIGLQQTFGWHISALVCGSVTLALGAVFGLQVLYVRGRVEALELGQRGELAVGQFLDQYLIPEGARVIHDVPADGFNLDHVVVAPQGVFVVETKTHTKPRFRDAWITFAEDGTLRAGGLPLNRDPIAQVRASSRWLSEFLTDSTGQAIKARSVVVFPGWYIEPMTRQWLTGPHPWVLEPKSLPSFLLREPIMLSDREVAMFANHLSRYVRAHEKSEREK